MAERLVHGSWARGLYARATAAPDAQAFVCLRAAGDDGDRLSYGRLVRRTATVAATLRRGGFAGQRALILHQPGPGFIEAFLGCLAAGVVAVPVQPPNPARLDAALDRFLGIVDNCEPAVALTGEGQATRLQPLDSRSLAVGRLAWIETGNIPDDTAAPWDPPDPDDEGLAFLQYTSGSTTAPKGVMVSHRNITDNARRIGQALSMSAESKGLSWLPLYHDMGLIGHVLQPLAYGIESVLMPPLAFLQRPMRWLDAISRFRATISFAPDFAYDLVARKARPEQLERLDLSSWATAGNGAEPVRAETMERFSRTFAACGFRQDAFCPSYGLAECTLLVSSRHGLVTTAAAAAALEEDRVDAREESSPDARRLVSLGPAAEGLQVEIVAPESDTSLPDGRIGEVWVKGSSVGAGYWGQPEVTESVFGARLADTGAGPFLRTGDLGFRRNGEIYITGRLKDLIVVDGRNHYPQDIEQTIEAHPAVSPGAVITFSVDSSSGERVVAVVEVARGGAAGRRDSASLTEAATGIRAQVSARHGLAVRDIIWLTRGSLPRTGSGKPRRRMCRDLFRRDELSGVVTRT